MPSLGEATPPQFDIYAQAMQTKKSVKRTCRGHCDICATESEAQSATSLHTEPCSNHGLVLFLSMRATRRLIVNERNKAQPDSDQDAASKRPNWEGPTLEAAINAPENQRTRKQAKPLLATSLRNQGGDASTPPALGPTCSATGQPASGARARKTEGNQIKSKGGRAVRMELPVAATTCVSKEMLLFPPCHLPAKSVPNRGEAQLPSAEPRYTWRRDSNRAMAFLWDGRMGPWPEASNPRARCTTAGLPGTIPTFRCKLTPPETAYNVCIGAQRLPRCNVALQLERKDLHAHLHSRRTWSATGRQGFKHCPHTIEWATVRRLGTILAKA